jgi:hypothetical protein
LVRSSAGSLTCPRTSTSGRRPSRQARPSIISWLCPVSTSRVGAASLSVACKSFAPSQQDSQCPARAQGRGPRETGQARSPWHSGQTRWGAWVGDPNPWIPQGTAPLPPTGAPPSVGNLAACASRIARRGRPDAGSRMQSGLDQRGPVGPRLAAELSPTGFLSQRDPAWTGGIHDGGHPRDTNPRHEQDATGWGRQAKHHGRVTGPGWLAPDPRYARPHDSAIGGALP